MIRHRSARQVHWPACSSHHHSFHSLFYLSYLVPPAALLSCSHSRWFSEFCRLLVQSFISCKINTGLSGSGINDLLTHQLVGLGSLFLVVVPIFVLSRLCLSILPMILPSFLLTSSLQNSSLKQSHLSQQFSQSISFLINWNKWSAVYLVIPPYKSSVRFPW